MTLFNQLEQELLNLAQNSNSNSARFFKCAPGEYAAHDIFVGIKVPDLRKLAKTYNKISQEDIITLLQSPYNEYRLLALFFMVDRYQKGSRVDKDLIYQSYMQNINCINNWNLVDSSAHLIVGAHVYHGYIQEDVINRLVHSDVLWHRRIAIISSWYDIRQNSFDTTLYLSKQLLNDQHDLIHKAVGWMLRELGKRDTTVLKNFLDQYAQNMPRVMLRYAIEHFGDVEYQFYLKKSKK